MLPRLTVRLLLPAVAALALAGCGAAADHPTASSTGAAPTGVATGTVAVAIRNFTYSPATLTVKVGTTVVWTQDDSTVHTVTDQGAFDSGTLDQGRTYRKTFDTPGTYSYICTIHPYMKASVTVVP